MIACATWTADMLQIRKHMKPTVLSSKSINDDLIWSSLWLHIIYNYDQVGDNTSKSIVN